MKQDFVQLQHRYHEDVERSYTLPSYFYFDPAVLEAERKEIFEKSWICVGHEEKVREPGDYFTVSLFDQNIVIIRGKDQVVRAFYNVCPHRGHELVSGEGNKPLIVCPYHAWSFQLDGRFHNGRAVRQMKQFDEQEACLRPVQVERFAHFLFVNLDPAAKPLQEMIPGVEEEIRQRVPVLDKLTLSHRISYEIKANWKNVLDNYLECHHCAVAHPQFVEIVDMAKYRLKTFDYHILQTGAGKKRLGSNRTPDDQENAVAMYTSYWLWPNLAIDIMPGEPGLIVMHVLPDGPETTVQHLEFYYLQKEPTQEGWANIEYQDKVLNPEDFALVESVQRGLRSKGYADGRYVVDQDRSSISEHAVHHFHGLVLKALGAR
ncbi:aromatic ring-hydroxylating oxygenase subunit alpha [Brevibacillus sp. B_LB10_24]|uniref:aromatic ring-hydroxylating oxygenase subunit alpha n=1 Tax=Brevibacillus sp. B_LB10_24 TaxID=3380645 RepID=UPI0038BB7DAF